MQRLSFTLSQSLRFALLSVAIVGSACSSSGDPLGEGSQPISDDDTSEEGDTCGGGVPVEAGEDCQVVARGVCFATAEAACACAGCGVDTCAIAESFPAQAFCQNDDPPSGNPDEPVSSDDDPGHDPGAGEPGCSGSGEPGGGSDPEPDPSGGGEACEAGTPRAAPDAPCDFVVGELCFESGAAACACAGCADECMVLESYPAQIRCPE